MAVNVHINVHMDISLSKFLIQFNKVCEAADDAYWRTDRLTTLELLQREWERGKHVCPLFSVFGIYNTLFKVDWLHCADHGIAADFLGSLFEHMVHKHMPGNNQGERCDALGALIMKYYDENNVLDQLKEFAMKSFQGSKRTVPPKLKGNAASVRALVPFGYSIAKEYLSDDVPIEQAMKCAAHHLASCYECLRESSIVVSHSALYEHSKAFALQYGALYTSFGSTVKWRPRPKMHMFLELCSSETEPQKFWNYRDGSFGGTVSRQSKMKGRWKTICFFCKHAHDMFRMKNQVPSIRD